MMVDPLVAMTPIFKVGQNDATLYGGDLSVTHRTTDWLTLQGTYEWVRGEFDDGGDVPLLPADQLSWRRSCIASRSAGWSRPSFASASAMPARRTRREHWSPSRSSTATRTFGTASTDAYTLLDLGFGFRYKNLRVDLFAKNVTDEDYRDFLDTYKGYALSPGRNIVVQTSLEF